MKNKLFSIGLAAILVFIFGGIAVVQAQQPVDLQPQPINIFADQTTVDTASTEADGYTQNDCPNSARPDHFCAQNPLQNESEWAEPSCHSIIDGTWEEQNSDWDVLFLENCGLDEPEQPVDPDTTIPDTIDPAPAVPVTAQPCTTNCCACCCTPVVMEWPMAEEQDIEAFYDLVVGLMDHGYTSCDITFHLTSGDNPNPLFAIQAMAIMSDLGWFNGGN